MAYDKNENRLRRKDAVGMQQLVQDFIKEMKLVSGVNSQRAAEAWNVVSGASRYTLDVSLDKGILYVIMNYFKKSKCHVKYLYITFDKSMLHGT